MYLIVSFEDILHIVRTSENAKKQTTPWLLLTTQLAFFSALQNRGKPASDERWQHSQWKINQEAQSSKCLAILAADGSK